MAKGSRTENHLQSRELFCRVRPVFGDLFPGSFPPKGYSIRGPFSERNFHVGWVLIYFPGQDKFWLVALLLGYLIVDLAANAFRKRKKSQQ